MAVDASNAIARSNRLIEGIREIAQRAMEPLAAEMAAVVAAKSPTPEEEYRVLMLGEGGESYDIPAFTGSGSADNDPTEPGRVRFRKDPATFLQALAENPDNRAVGPNYARIGNARLLQEGSYFQYLNYVPKRHPRPAEGWISVGPYFDAFEYGTGDFSNWDVRPRGQGYPLRPDEDPSHRPKSMFKPIYARFAYSPIDLEEIARRFLDGTFAKEGRG